MIFFIVSLLNSLSPQSSLDFNSGKKYHTFLDINNQLGDYWSTMTDSDLLFKRSRLEKERLNELKGSYWGHFYLSELEQDLLSSMVHRYQKNYLDFEVQPSDYAYSEKQLRGLLDLAQAVFLGRRSSLESLGKNQMVVLKKYYEAILSFNLNLQQEERKLRDHLKNYSDQLKNLGHSQGVILNDYNEVSFRLDENLKTQLPFYDYPLFSMAQYRERTLEGKKYGDFFITIEESQYLSQLVERYMKDPRSFRLQPSEYLKSQILYDGVMSLSSAISFGRFVHQDVILALESDLLSSQSITVDEEGKSFLPGAILRAILEHFDNMIVSSRLLKTPTDEDYVRASKMINFLDEKEQAELTVEEKEKYDRFHRQGFEALTDEEKQDYEQFFYGGFGGYSGRPNGFSEKTPLTYRTNFIDLSYSLKLPLDQINALRKVVLYVYQKGFSFTQEKDVQLFREYLYKNVSQDLRSLIHSLCLSPHLLDYLLYSLKIDLSLVASCSLSFRGLLKLIDSFFKEGGYLDYSNASYLNMDTVLTSSSLRTNQLVVPLSSDLLSYSFSSLQNFREVVRREGEQDSSSYVPIFSNLMKDETLPRDSQTLKNCLAVEGFRYYVSSRPEYRVLFLGLFEANPVASVEALKLYILNQIYSANQTISDHNKKIQSRGLRIFQFYRMQSVQNISRDIQEYYVEFLEGIKEKDVLSIPQEFPEESIYKSFLDFLSFLKGEPVDHIDESFKVEDYYNNIRSILFDREKSNQLMKWLSFWESKCLEQDDVGLYKNSEILDTCSFLEEIYFSKEDPLLRGAQQIRLLQKRSLLLESSDEFKVFDKEVYPYYLRVSSYLKSMNSFVNYGHSVREEKKEKEKSLQQLSNHYQSRRLRERWGQFEEAGGKISETLNSFKMLNDAVQEKLLVYLNRSSGRMGQYEIDEFNEILNQETFENSVQEYSKLISSLFDFKKFYYEFKDQWLDIKETFKFKGAKEHQIYDDLDLFFNTFSSYLDQAISIGRHIDNIRIIYQCCFQMAFRGRKVTEKILVFIPKPFSKTLDEFSLEEVCVDCLLHNKFLLTLPLLDRIEELSDDQFENFVVNLLDRLFEKDCYGEDLYKLLSSLYLYRDQKRMIGQERTDSSFFNSSTGVLRREGPYHDKVYQHILDARSRVSEDFIFRLINEKMFLYFSQPDILPGYLHLFSFETCGYDIRFWIDEWCSRLKNSSNFLEDLVQGTYKNLLWMRFFYEQKNHRLQKFDKDFDSFFRYKVSSYIVGRLKNDVHAGELMDSFWLRLGEYEKEKKLEQQQLLLKSVPKKLPQQVVENHSEKSSAQLYQEEKTLVEKLKNDDLFVFFSSGMASTDDIPELPEKMVESIFKLSERSRSEVLQKAFTLIVRHTTGFVDLKKMTNWLSQIFLKAHQLGYFSFEFSYDKGNSYLTYYHHSLSYMMDILSNISPSLFVFFIEATFHKKSSISKGDLPAFIYIYLHKLMQDDETFSFEDFFENFSGLFFKLKDRGMKNKKILNLMDVLLNEETLPSFIFQSHEFQSWFSQQKMIYKTQNVSASRKFLLRSLPVHYLESTQFSA